MLSVAWDLMTPEQRLQFREHPDTAALIEAAGTRLYRREQISAGSEVSA